ncbi:hypothetical protein [Paracoccus chinensis]|uniref:hypothetical protein n=1 Tax=Paracoccus chinensis TaxID=525640 RepID=UPI0011141C39|nr:hypothetical protein [Paracoccus chinensis]
MREFLKIARLFRGGLRDQSCIAPWRHEVQVDARDPVGTGMVEPCRDEQAPVASLRFEPWVTERVGYQGRHGFG